MVSCQVAPQKFLPCSNTAVLERNKRRLKCEQRQEEYDHAQCEDAERAPASTTARRQCWGRVLGKIYAYLVIVVLMMLLLVRGSGGLHSSFSFFLVVRA